MQSNDNDTVVHDDIPCPSYEKLIKAAKTLSDAEEIVLRERSYSSNREREWFYDNKNAAQQAVEDACKKGQEAEQGTTTEQQNDPSHVAFAYKTLRLFTRFALLAIKNYNARAEYINTIAGWAGKYGKLLAEDPKLAAERAVATRNTIRQAFLSKTSASNRYFDDLIKSKGHDFQSLMDHCREQIYPDKTMKALTESERAEVFAKIIEDSGRSSFTHDLIFNAEGAIGWAVIIATLGLLVFDVVTNAQSGYVEKVAEVLGDAAEFGAVWFGAAAAEALAIAEFGEASTFAVAFFGFAGGVIAGLVVTGIIQGLTFLFESLFSSPHDLWDKYISQVVVYKVTLPKVDLDI